MKVTYSVATNFGGSGIGTTSYWAAKGIYDAGNLDKVFVSSYKLRDIPKEYIRSTNSSFIEGFGFISSSYQWLMKDNYHDFVTSLNSTRSDIFHGWNGHSLFSLRSFKKKGAKIVIERASSHPNTQVSILENELSKHGIKSNSMLPVNLKKLIREFEETDHITVPSEFAYQSMVDQGIPKEKMVVLPFGVDLEYFKPGEKKEDETFKVLFVGQVGFRKGVLYLLEAWEQLKLKNAKLLVVGQVDSNFENYVTKYQQNKSIEFLGFSPTLPLYQNSNVFVFPSLEEGSALVNYEALATGLPVITTFNSGSIVEDGKEGYIIEPSSSDSIADKLQLLYDDRKKLNILSKNAREKAEKYSWENYGKRLNKFYEKILN